MDKHDHTEFPVTTCSSMFQYNAKQNPNLSWHSYVYFSFSCLIENVNNVQCFVHLLRCLLILGMTGFVIYAVDTFHRVNKSLKLYYIKLTLCKMPRLVPMLLTSLVNCVVLFSEKVCDCEVLLLIAST